MIEAWGRGIERIIEACREASTPEPEFRYEQSGLWVVEKILVRMAANPLITIEELAGRLG